MSKRDEILDFVDRRRSDRVLFAPLVDSLFSMWASGKEWHSDATLEDQIAAGIQGGYHPLFVAYAPYPAYDAATRPLAAGADSRSFEHAIETPRGRLVQRTEDRRRESGVSLSGDWVQEVEQLDAVDWISEQVISGARDAAIRKIFSEAARKTREHGALEYQLELPFFLYGLVGFSHIPILFHLTETARFADSMALAERALLRMCDLLIESGVDFIWIGAPGTEVSSPAIMEEVIIPQAQRMVAHVHARGGRVHFHCCGQSRLWIEKGYFNRIGMDLLETLSAPPSGNVDDLAAARRKVDPRIVTKGNIDLELILKGSMADCRAAARRVMEAVRGFPHLMGGGDALLYGTPIDNVRAIRDECEKFRG